MEEFSFWWSKRQHARWQVTRLRGAFHFISFYGVLVLGLGCFLLVDILPAGWEWYIHTGSKAYPRIVTRGIGSVVMGLLWGIVVWTLSERAFHRHEPRN
jgi:hypothetical protein